MKKISIVVPAYNEEGRIGKTLQNYTNYFNQLRDAKKIDFEFVVVLNGCIDGTRDIVQSMKSRDVVLLDLKEAGKGIALAAGFKNALTRNNDIIGFVDADMATKPQYFYALIQYLECNDGAIASRYMKGSQVYPSRPWIKEWGRKVIYNGLARLVLGLSYHDLQCGAKIFKRKVIEKVAPHLTVRQWASDAELLYLCKKFGFSVNESPTVWYDQDDSKLKLRSGMRMLGALFALRFRHAQVK